MTLMKVMVLAQKVGPEEIINGHPTGNFPHGLESTAAFRVNGLRIQKRLKAGEVLEMDFPDAKKFNNMGLTRKAHTHEAISVSSAESVGGYCGICDSKLESDSQLRAGYCDDECKKRATLNREEEEARKNPVQAAAAKALAESGIRPVEEDDSDTSTTDESDKTETNAEETQTSDDKE